MPKLDLAGLIALTARANIADIELSVLQELYYKHLHPYTFVFELTNGEVFKLKFDREKFCHLIGLDKVPKALVAARSPGWHNRRVSEYKGPRGWDNILDGTIDMAHMTNLAARVSGGLGESLRKLVNFYYLPELMKTGSLVIEYTNPQPGTTINCELFIYDVHDSLYIQIGLKKDPQSCNKWYYPETFIINTAGPGHPNPRVIGNTVHNVTTRSILNRYSYIHTYIPNSLRKHRYRRLTKNSIRKHRKRH